MFLFSSSETINETYKTDYVTAGSSFTLVCPNESTKWTFQARSTTSLQNSVQGPEKEFVTSNKFISIVNVKRDDAGLYTCWMRKCYGHEQKLHTINLCVITGEKTIHTYTLTWSYVNIKWFNLF